MKNLAVLGILVVACATPLTWAADGEWDPKACMKRCVKVVKEDMDARIKEGRLEQHEHKVKNGKVDMQEVRKTCEFICQVNG